MALRILWPDSAPQPPRQNKRRLPTFFREDEVLRLLHAAELEIERASMGANHHGRFACCVHVFRFACQDRLILVLGAYLGLRVSEQTGLRVSDVNLANREIRVIGKGNVERIVPIPLRMMSEIEYWVAIRKSGTLLRSRRNRRMHTSTVNSRLRRLAKLAGLNKRIHSHALRHTFGTRVYSLTKDMLLVRDLLGHRSVATTQVYTHCVIDEARDAVDRL